MSEQKKRNRNINNTQKINNLYLDSNPEDIYGEPQMTTTISSYNNKKPKKESQNNLERKKFHITFNKTLKSNISKEQSKKKSKTQTGL